VKVAVQLERASARGAPAVAPRLVDEVLRSPGRPLEPAVRTEMEDRLGHDFSRVRVHTDGGSAASARALGARAYTVNPEIVFDSGRYAPTTPEGRRLLAHELAHVVQQQGVTAPDGRARDDAAGGTA
jgi:Domain of unknown function (DUF4157)